jgi:hypothetical protein
MLSTAGFDERKAAESVTPFVPILDLQPFSIRAWNFDGLCLPCKVLGLIGDLAVELRQHPKEPVQIDHNYFWEGFAFIFAEWKRAPRHLIDLSPRKAG